MKKKETKTETSPTEEKSKTKRTTRTRKKAEVKPTEEQASPIAPVEESKEKPVKKRTRKAAKPTEPSEPTKPIEQEKPIEPSKPIEPTKPSKPIEPTKPIKPIEPTKPIKPIEPTKPIKPAIPSMPEIKVKDFCDLVNQGGRIPLLNDQQIQMLTWEDAQNRCERLERVLCSVLDYDIVLSDTNIWLELLVGHSSSHSDPRVNARLQFERQLESLSKMMKRIGGRFMVMSETYEEIDRFASASDPVNYKDADWTDEALCRNVAARLAKRLMLAQQKENRLRIEGIGSESHHASFADPAIIRRTVEFFSIGKKVLLLTNDTSVGIRSLGMCDDLQRVNEIDDQTWRDVYEPQRPMVLTMDDLKVLDTYMRQYYYLSTAAGRTWMQDAQQRKAVILETPLQLWLEGFRPSSRGERRNERKEQERKEQERKEQERKEQERKEQERREQERKEQERKEQERREQQRRADRERAEARRKAEQEAAEARRKAEQEAAEARRKAEQEAAELKAAEQKAAEQNTEPQPIEENIPSTESVTSESVTEEETAAPEEKKSRSRRGGRGRRSKKSPDAV